MLFFIIIVGICSEIGSAAKSKVVVIVAEVTVVVQDASAVARLWYQAAAVGSLQPGKVARSLGFHRLSARFARAVVPVGRSAEAIATWFHWRRTWARLPD